MIIILSMVWLWELLSFVLKPCHLSFKPRSDPFITRHVWLIMPSLLLQFWDKGCLESIRYFAGKFLFDEKLKDCVDKRCT